MSAVLRVEATMAPPPTRRSTGRRRRMLRRGAGSSAHAEINPRNAAPATSSTWLLRPRGDQPFQEMASRGTMLAPPPTRRSTPLGGESRRALRGSSAHAEINPVPRATERARERLLRPRGDQPFSDEGALRRQRAPPPTRRSTVNQIGIPRRVAGSSAHAEINPRRPRSACAARRLLRPRGDQPRRSAGAARDHAAPPPTRRSTVRQARGHLGRDGSSAHAEINRR